MKKEIRHFIIQKTGKAVQRIHSINVEDKEKKEYKA